jgi:hypothetical protein
MTKDNSNLAEQNQIFQKNPKCDFDFDIGICSLSCLLLKCLYKKKDTQQLVLLQTKAIHLNMYLTFRQSLHFI